MANRYWVAGGTGNWNDTSNWSASSGGASGASVPGASDAVLLDANSGAGTVTLDISPDIQTLTCTGFTGTLAFGTNTISLNSTGVIFTGATTMTVTGTPQIICTNATATGRTISPQVVTEANSISFRITAGTGIVTITSTHAVRNLDFTDGVNPTGYAGALGTQAFTVYGSLTASTGMTVTASNSAITFAATSGTKTINTAGVTVDRPLTFNGVGGTFQLAAAATLGATRACTLTNGTLDLASYTLTTGIFSSSNTNTRTLAFGTGNITATGNSLTVFTISDSTNLTISGTPTVNLIYAGSTGTRQISASLTSASANTALNYNVSAGSDILTFGTAARVVNDVNFTGFSGTITELAKNFYGSLTLAATNVSVASTSAVTFKATSGTKTITTAGLAFDFPITFDGVGGTWAFADALTQGSTRAFTITNGAVALKNGATSTVGAFATSGTNQKYLQSTLAGSQATLSQASGTVSTSYLTIQDINATGGAVWQAYTTNQNVDAGNNDGWDFSSQLGKYIYTRRKNKRILP